MIRLNFFLVAFVSLGCSRSKSEFRPLADGFGYVTVKGGIDRAPGEELHYRGPDGRDVLIYDKVSSRVIVANNMAIFSGERLVGPEPGEPKGYLESRLFAVRVPGPAIDITAQVRKIGEKAEGRELQLQGSKNDGFVSFAQEGAKMVATFVGNDMQDPGLHVSPTWDQISNILSSAVTETGK
jgi:hypothetical protein